MLFSPLVPGHQTSGRLVGVQIISKIPLQVETANPVSDFINIGKLQASFTVDLLKI